MEIRNAIIKRTELSNMDHGALTVWLDLDYGSSCQGFGGYCLYSDSNWEVGRGKNYAGRFINRVMAIAEVSSWEELPGKAIRVRIENGLIKGIGNLLKEDWFIPSVDFGE